QELELAVERRMSSTDSWPDFVNAVNNIGQMQLSFSSDPSMKGGPPGQPCCDQLQEQLVDRLHQPYSYAFQPDSDVVEVRVAMPDGTLIARIDRKRDIMVTAPQFIGWSVAFALVLLTASYLFLRNQVRSIVQLSSAADSFGRGEDAPDFKPSGAKEVRQAA